MPPILCNLLGKEPMAAASTKTNEAFQVQLFYKHQLIFQLLGNGGNLKRRNNQTQDLLGH